MAGQDGNERVVRGVASTAAPVDSRSGEAIDRFRAVIPVSADEEQVLFGRGPENTRVTVRLFDPDNEGELQAALTAFAKDIGRSVPDSHVVKTIDRRSITVGDIRDYVERIVPIVPPATSDGPTAKTAK